MIGQLAPSVLLAVVAGYFLLLIGISFLTGGDRSNSAFFMAGRQSKWYLVAYAMIGTTISGVTFVSVPGVVGAGGLNQSFSYMQVVMGNYAAYIFIALVLLPLYYRLHLVSIYGYLEQRFGQVAYRTGAFFFLVSRTIGTAFRLYLVAVVFQVIFNMMEGVSVPFWLTVVLTIGLIWVYTFRAGIKTIIWTDLLQTTAFLLAVVITLYSIGQQLGVGTMGLVGAVRNSPYSQWFFFEHGWSDPNNFFKQFLGGLSIGIVMTGLDQDMMQKNLTCKTLGEAQKNMFTFSALLLVVNVLFVSLGALVYVYAADKGIELPKSPDQVYPTIALQYMSPVLGILFVLGLIAAAYSSADSALTALTTSFCIDFLGFNQADKEKRTLLGKKWRTIDDVRLRSYVHIGFSVLLFFVILLFGYINDRSVINQLFKIAGFTYGPLLGLFAFGILTRRAINDPLSLVVCVLSPILVFLLDTYSETWLGGYKFSFELLIVNGFITFVGLWLISSPPISKHST